MDHILGQSRAIETLAAALASDRLHHAYIFHGPVGVGKFTTAMAFAKVLLCVDRSRDLAGQVVACDLCASCRYFNGAVSEEGHEAGEGHPDLHVIRKELAAVSSVTKLRGAKQMNIPVDIVREHVVGGTTGDGKFHEAPAYRSASVGRNKVFVVDEAELLDAPGQNALLKTLEEPPAGTYLILVTSSEDRLLPTIRSRCQRVGFASLTDQMVGDWIAKRDDAPQGDALRWLVMFADGSLGRAALGMEYSLYDWVGVIVGGLDDMARGRSDPSLGSTLADMINQFAAQWVKDHANASKEAANKRAAALAWSVIARHARQCMRQAAEGAGTGDVHAVEAAVSPWLGVIAALGVAERELGANLNLSLVCDHLVSMMARSLGGGVPSRLVV